MAVFYVSVLILLEVLHLASSYEISLQGPVTAIRGDLIWLNCTSSVEPSGQLAEFLINGVTLDSLRLQNNTCFTTRKICSPESCLCSADGKMYAIRILISKDIGPLEVLCSMSFSFAMPFFKNASWTVLVTEPPMPKVKTQGSLICNTSCSVKLVCNLSGLLDTYSFDYWNHFIDGVVIRQLNSSIQSYRSTLYIQNCSFKDAGEYVCSAWNEKDGKKYYSNSTLKLSVYGPPVIVETDTYMNEGSFRVFSVLYYTAAAPDSPRWLQNGKHIIQNSTTFKMATSQKTTPLLIYDRIIVYVVFSSKLSVLDDFEGDFTVVLGNNFGTTIHSFNGKPGQTGFSLQTLFWALTAVIVLIVTVGITDIIIKRKSMNMSFNAQFQRSVERAAIYYAAPSDENNIHIYNSPNGGDQDSVDDTESAHYTEIMGPYEELDQDKDEPQSDIPHDYLEL